MSDEKEQFQMWYVIVATNQPQPYKKYTRLKCAKWPWTAIDLYDWVQEVLHAMEVYHGYPFVFEAFGCTVLVKYTIEKYDGVYPALSYPIVTEIASELAGCLVTSNESDGSDFKEREQKDFYKIRLEELGESIKKYKR